MLFLLTAVDLISSPNHYFASSINPYYLFYCFFNESSSNVSFMNLRLITI